MRGAAPPILERIPPRADGGPHSPGRQGDPEFHEYGVEVHSARGSEHAEGGSRPSVIIDP